MCQRSQCRLETITRELEKRSRHWEAPHCRNNGVGSDYTLSHVGERRLSHRLRPSINEVTLAEVSNEARRGRWSAMCNMNFKVRVIWGKGERMIWKH